MSIAIRDSFDSAIARSLALKLAEQIKIVGHNLAHGSAMMATPDLTAQKYSEELGYVRALNDVLAICHELEEDFHGRGKSQSGVPS